MNLINLLSRKKIFFSLLWATVFIAGCTLQFGSREPSVAGVFKSFDKGETWVEKNLFLHSGGAASLSGTNVLNLTFDPQDSRAVYLAADAAGLFYSYDAADSWMKANQVGDGRIEVVAVDPWYKCTVYATFANTILKSYDCSRSWEEIYIDPQNLTALAIDPANNLVIYAGNAAGDVLKSVDGGNNWQVIDRFNNKIAKILIDPNNTRVAYIATQSKGLFRTDNAGGYWGDISDGLRQFSGALEYKNLIFNPSELDSLILAAKYGLLKTVDGGQTWEVIKLITPPGATDIYSIAVDPKNSREIYYATKTTFYKTVDGGQNWVTKRLPTNAVATYLVVDPIDSNIIYLGAANLE